MGGVRPRSLEQPCPAPPVSADPGPDLRHDHVLPGGEGRRLLHVGCLPPATPLRCQRTSPTGGMTPAPHCRTSRQPGRGAGSSGPVSAAPAPGLGAGGAWELDAPASSQRCFPQGSGQGGRRGATAGPGPGAQGGAAAPSPTFHSRTPRWARPPGRLDKARGQQPPPRVPHCPAPGGPHSGGPVRSRILHPLTCTDPAAAAAEPPCPPLGAPAPPADGR